jgi:uncharacterized protein HemY
VEFEASLKRAPKRLTGLFGAARSAELAGNPERAKLYYAELAEVTKSGDATRPEVEAARKAVGQLARR